VVFRNFEGRVFEYPEVQSAQSLSHNGDHSSLKGMISGATIGADSKKAITC